MFFRRVRYTKMHYSNSNFDFSRGAKSVLEGTAVVPSQNGTGENPSRFGNIYVFNLLMIQEGKLIRKP